MINNKIVSKFIDAVFLNPQKSLGGLDGDRKLDNVHLIFVKLLSGSPIKGRGTKLDPLMLKIGFTGIEEDMSKLLPEDLSSINDHLKQFNDIIGSWTLVHDFPATKDAPKWRLSAEICPTNVRELKIEDTEEEDSRKILCVDFEGVGIFMGKPLCK
jgi:hypothetical protein